jgi:hypothetical protein
MSDTVPEASRSQRRVALMGLGAAVAFSVLGWVYLGRAATAGVRRLETLDRVRVPCDSAWRAARRREDTLAVDKIALADTVDERSANAIDQCADLREPDKAGAVPPAREMTGQPMPRGLR